MKISNILLSAAIVTATCGFSASVTKKNYDELSGNDDIVVDVDLSGISGGADTNAVNDLIGEYDRTNLACRIDRKRDKTDLNVYRKVKDCWTWTNWNNPEEPLAREAPGDFLALANSPGSDPIFFRNGAWWGAVQFWPNGKVKYSQSDIPPAGTGEYSTTLNFAMFAYDETGTNELFRFGATARRTDPTNETVVAWNETRNEYVRIATTDMVDDSIRREVRASTNGLASVAYVDSATNGLRKVEGAARPLPRYLHFQHFDDSYPDDAAWYYGYVADPVGLCSARRVGNLLERNYDWLYDNAATFVIEMSEGPGRLASVGVASCGENLSEDFVNSGKWSRFYKCLPGRTVDGVNSRGVAINVNVVVTNGVATWEHHVPGDGRDIDSQWAVRYVLDNAPNAQWAATNLANRVYISSATLKQGFSVHYAIIDNDSTWLVEDGQAFRWNGRVALAVTNFRLTYGSSISQFKKNDPYGSGYERYMVIAGEGSSITQAWYTKAYRRGTDGDFPWPSEFAGETNALGHKITCMETEELQAWAKANIPVGAPEIFPRGVGTWQTVHTSIYDISNLTLRVAVQEKDDWYSFSVPNGGKVQSVNGMTGNVTLDAEDVGALPRNDDYYWLEADDTGFWFDGWGPDSGAGLYADGGEGCVYVYDEDGDVDLMTTKIRANGVTLDYPTNRNESGTLITTGNVDQHALKNDAESLKGNDNFKEAVKAVSPSVVLPQKWALSNITNAQGQTVNADDVGAMSNSGLSIITGDGIVYFFGGEYPSGKHLEIFPDTATIDLKGFDEDGTSELRITPVSITTKETDGNQHRYTWDSFLTLLKVYDEVQYEGSPADNYPVNSKAIRKKLAYYPTKDEMNTLSNKLMSAIGDGIVKRLYSDNTNSYLTADGEHYTLKKEETFVASMSGQPSYTLRWNESKGGWYCAPFFSSNPSAFGLLTWTESDSTWRLNVGNVQTFSLVGTRTQDNFHIGMFDIARRFIESGGYEKDDEAMFRSDMGEFRKMNDLSYRSDFGWLDLPGELINVQVRDFGHTDPQGGRYYWSARTAQSSSEYIGAKDSYGYMWDTPQAASNAVLVVFSNPHGGEEIIAHRGYKDDRIALVSQLPTLFSSARLGNSQGRKRYAMFIIRMNDAGCKDGDSCFTQFELVATTNGHCCFRSQSESADGFSADNDRMRLFVDREKSGCGHYEPIANTVSVMPDHAPSDLVVIVDSTIMNPVRSDGSWLSDENEDVVWSVVRMRNGKRELDSDGVNALWRPVAPVRWFSKLPSWAR